MSPPKNQDPLSYSAIEVRSYLPSGWNLEEAEGSYSARQRHWHIEVQDVSEVVRTLAVKQKDADKLGRIPALRTAVDRLYRRA